MESSNKRNRKNLISSQRSPKTMLTPLKTVQMGQYANMFIQDFCSFLSLESHNYSHLLSVNNQQLLELLKYDNRNLCYELEKDFSQVATILLLYGKAYAEIITVKSKTGELDNISFRILNTDHAKKTGDFVHFSAQSLDKEDVQFIIPARNLIVFDLKDLGFNRKYFARLIAKMNKLDLPTELFDSHDFDISIYSQKVEKQLLKINKRTHWFGRNYNNQYMNDAYLLYRIMYFKELQWQFLKYIVSKYNEALSTLNKSENVQGQITIQETVPDFDNYYKKLNEGQINFEQLNNLLYHP